MKSYFEQIFINIHSQKWNIIFARKAQEIYRVSWWKDGGTHIIVYMQQIDVVEYIEKQQCCQNSSQQQFQMSVEE